MDLGDIIFDTVLFLFKSNRDFFKLLCEFHDKLPPRHKMAKKDPNLIPHVTTLDTTQMKMNLTTTDIDLFHKKLENFNYSRIIFKRKAIKSYSDNIQRLLRESNWEKFGVALIQNLLEDEHFGRLKPYLFGQRIGKFIGF
jgi:hypothetical protein